MIRMRIFALLLTVSVLAMPAAAQSKKELAAQDAALAQRLSTLERRMLTGDPAAERLMARMDSLEASQRTLTGETERLRFERDKLRAEISALNDDLQAMQSQMTELQALSGRVKAHLDTAASAPQYAAPLYRSPSDPITYDGSPNVGQSGLAGGYSAGQPSAIPGPPVLQERTISVQENYSALATLPNSGKQKLAEGNFSGAQSDFSQYLEGMPDAPDAGEIHFWLGETYYVRRGYADAADAYIASMRKDPQGIKAPDSMVRLAAALRGLGKKDEACRTLDSFTSQYPQASADVRAKHRTELSRTGC